MGAKTGLRGYRNERFAGKSAYGQSTDSRWNFNDLKTGLLPIHIVFFGAFDYGRVWIGDGLRLGFKFGFIF